MWKLIIIIMLIIFIAPIHAGMECKIVSQCQQGWITLMKMSSTNDSHVALWNDTQYNTSLCCNNEPSELTRDCNNDGSVTLAKISGIADAHTEQQNLDNYSTKICLFDTHNKLFVAYKTACADSEICAFSMSGTTNAHIGSCGIYATNACISTTATGAGDAATGGAAGGTGSFVPTPIPTPFIPIKPFLPASIQDSKVQQNQTQSTIIQTIMQTGKTPIQNTNIPMGLPIIIGIAALYTISRKLIKMEKGLRKVKENQKKTKETSKK